MKNIIRRGTSALAEKTAFYSDLGNFDFYLRREWRSMSDSAFELLYAPWIHIFYAAEVMIAVSAHQKFIVARMVYIVGTYRPLESNRALKNRQSAGHSFAFSRGRPAVRAGVSRQPR
jgi:hypothetical protein